MATIDLGKIKLVNKGTWASGTTYAKDDLVQYTDGAITSTYISVVTSSQGHTPSSGGTTHASWDYLAKGGSTVNGERLGGAWAKYNPSGSVDESYNVSSVTDNGEGEQTVNFSSNCANADYAVAAVCTYPSGTNEHFVSLGGRNNGWNSGSAQNSGSCKLWTIYAEGSGNAQDVSKIHCIFMGDWS